MLRGPLPTNKTQDNREICPPSTVDELHYTNHPLNPPDNKNLLHRAVTSKSYCYKAIKVRQIKLAL